jgi:hypothetical protein
MLSSSIILFFIAQTSNSQAIKDNTLSYLFGIIAAMPARLCWSSIYAGSIMMMGAVIPR